MGIGTGSPSGLSEGLSLEGGLDYLGSMVDPWGGHEETFSFESRICVYKFPPPK